jgi:flavodoxin, long chain
MNKIGIFYGSATGTTSDVARRIAKLLSVPDKDIHDVAETAPHVMGDYDVLLLGSSTWGNGELEDDWYDFIDGAQSLDLSGKKFAVFGCGDETMSDTFCNAVGILYDRIQPLGATLIGEFPAEGYSYDHSEASAPGGMMRGMVLDEVNHPELTPQRLSLWADELKKQM